MTATPADPVAAARGSIDEMIRTAHDCGAFWSTPRAPGKWSPAQVVEHVARSFEESGKDIRGEASAFPKLPRLVRPLARRFLFDRVLRDAAFPRAKTNRAMDPASGPGTPREAAERLEQAWSLFAAAHREVAARRSEFVSQTFGRVRLADYVRFQEIHARHHRAQMRPPA